ncbi:hypothetical protein [Clostridium chrysemydis]|nr:hypothetical protein [Clostridium chrysemydis]
MDIKKYLYSGDFSKIPTKKQNNVVVEIKINIDVSELEYNLLFRDSLSFV